MRVIIDIPNDKFEEYGRALVVFLTEGKKPTNIDETLARAKETDEITLNTSQFGDDETGFMLGITSMVIAQLGLEEKEEER